MTFISEKVHREATMSVLLWLDFQVLREPFRGVGMVFRKLSMKMNITGDPEGKKNSLSRRCLNRRGLAGFGVREPEILSLLLHLLCVRLGASS